VQYLSFSSEQEFVVAMRNRAKKRRLGKKEGKNREK
jgi:hypothetical protein